MGILPWTSEARYLGIYVVAGTKFSCNFSNSKSKFYRSANAILGKLGSQRNPAVAMQLISSVALPILTFGTEALDFTKTQTISLEHPWTRIFMKVYSTFDSQTVKLCQFYSGTLPLNYNIAIRKVAFINKLFFTDNGLLIFFYESKGIPDILEIAAKFNLFNASFQYNTSDILHEHFSNSL